MPPYSFARISGFDGNIYDWGDFMLKRESMKYMESCPDFLWIESIESIHIWEQEWKTATKKVRFKTIAIVKKRRKVDQH